MAVTPSTMTELGSIAPPFELVDVRNGKAMSRDDIFARSWDDNLSDATNLSTHGGPAQKHGLLVMFVCPHCPFVKHVEAEIGRVAEAYGGMDGDGPIAIAAIQSNDLGLQPNDGPAEMREQAERNGWNFPYLLDENQEVARSYGAACTPDFFLYDAAMKLVYRGQLDDSRPNHRERPLTGPPEPVTGKDLRAALDAVIAGKRPDPNQRGSIGCNIKWREA